MGERLVAVVKFERRKLVKEVRRVSRRGQRMTVSIYFYIYSGVVKNITIGRGK